MKTLERVKTIQKQQRINRNALIKKESKELKQIEKSSIDSIKSVENTAKRNINTLLRQKKKQKRLSNLLIVILLITMTALITASATYVKTSQNYENEYHECKSFQVTKDKKLFCKL